MFNLAKLCAVLKSSKDEQEKSYRKRLKAYQEMMGQHSPYNGSAGPRPINLLDLGMTIYKQFLVPSNPRCSLTARKRELIPDAYSFELAINAVLGEEYVPVEIETAVSEAMFAPLGVIKIYQDADDIVEIDGLRISVGTPKLKAITYDNWIQDMSAGSPESVAFCGDRYYMDRQEALESGLFDPELIAKLPVEDANERDWTDSQSLRDIRFNEDYREMLELWDIWLPNEGVLLTLPKGFEAKELRRVQWSGPKDGPYERLFFSPLPGNSLPNPPVGMWIDLHTFENRIWNKLQEQAIRQKTNEAVNTGDKDDGEKLKNAKDGEYLVLNDVRSQQTLRAGGPDQVNFAMALQTKQLFDYMAGNLSGLGGLQAMSGTAKQDEMLTEGASQRLRQMQGRVRDFMRRVTRQVANHLYESRLLNIPIEKQVGDMKIAGEWNRESMQGEFPDYLVDIDPYSLHDRTPQERLSMLREFWLNDMQVSAPIMQMEGKMPSFEGYAKQFAKLADMPEINDLYTHAQGQMMPGEEMTQKPDTTTRRYERVSKSPGMSQQGQDAAMISKMLTGATSNQ